MESGLISDALKFALSTHLAINLLTIRIQKDVLKLIKTIEIVWMKICEYRKEKPDDEIFVHIFVGPSPSKLRKERVKSSHEEIKDKPIIFESKGLMEILKQEEAELSEEKKKKQDLANEILSSKNTSKKFGPPTPRELTEAEKTNLKLSQEMNRKRVEKANEVVKSLKLDDVEMSNDSFILVEEPILKRELIDMENSLIQEKKNVSSLKVKINEMNELATTKTVARIKNDLYLINGWLRDKDALNHLQVKKLKAMHQIVLQTKSDKTFDERLDIVLNSNEREMKSMSEILNEPSLKNYVRKCYSAMKTKDIQTDDIKINQVEIKRILSTAAVDNDDAEEQMKYVCYNIGRMIKRDFG